MEKNMGQSDRVLRVSAAAGAAVLILTGQVKGTPALVMGALATVFLVTSSVAYCPAYAAVGINSLNT